MYHIVPDNGESIAEAIWNGTAIAITDGSFQAQMGTSAFILEGENLRNHLVSVNQAPGQLRIKLARCYSVVSTVRAICEEYGITQGLIKVVYDNIEALHRTVDQEYFISSPNHSHFDLTTVIQSQVKAMPTT